MNTATTQGLPRPENYRATRIAAFLAAGLCWPAHLTFIGSFVVTDSPGALLLGLAASTLPLCVILGFLLFLGRQGTIVVCFGLPVFTICALWIARSDYQVESYGVPLALATLGSSLLPGATFLISQRRTSGPSKLGAA